MVDEKSKTASVRKELLLDVDQQRAFGVFTGEIGQWWPLVSHHIGQSTPEVAVIEPFVNGRWFERSMDGSECDWGRVLVWDPPRRLVLTWCINSRWQFEGTLATEVEVQFTEVGAGRTKVVLEHRHLDRFGADAERMRGIFDSEGGWTGILRSYAARTNDQAVSAPACPHTSVQEKAI